MNDEADPVSVKIMDATLLTPRAVAALIGRKPWTVYRLIRTGELPSVMIGGTLRVPRAAIQKLIDDAMNAPVPART